MRTGRNPHQKQWRKEEEAPKDRDQPSSSEDAPNFEEEAERRAEQYYQTCLACKKQSEFCEGSYSYLQHLPWVSSLMKGSADVIYCGRLKRAIL